MMGNDAPVAFRMSCLSSAVVGAISGVRIAVLVLCGVDCVCMDWQFTEPLQGDCSMHRDTMHAINQRHHNMHSMQQQNRLSHLAVLYCLPF